MLVGHSFSKMIVTEVEVDWKMPGIVDVARAPDANDDYNLQNGSKKARADLSNPRAGQFEFLGPKS